MSRCFPFPPPGYDKKFTTHESDSLLKEKLKEKKHKKEKKDKEKKEGKEKKDKEKSKDKHKERKEKKEKHKDRKDKNRDKEKSRTLEDRKATGVLPNNGDKEKLVPNTLHSNGNGDSKFIQDLARRIRDEEATESQSLRKIDIPCGVTENNNSYPVPQTNHKNSAMAKRSESPVLRESSCMDQKGAEVIFKSVEQKDQAKRKELLEKNHRRESVTKSDKPLTNGGIRKSEPNNITDRSSKEKKTEVMNKNVLKKPKFVEGGPRLKGREHDVVDTRGFRESDHPNAGVKNLTAEGILGKRKDLQTNGLLYENGSRPNEIPTPVGSSMSSVENGRNSVACQTHQKLPKLVSELQETVSNPEVKEHKINGFIFSQEVKCHSPVSSGKVKESVEVSARKRPHPDLKYLDQLLNVPKREELPEVDDDEQDWLFGQSGVKLLKKQRADYTNSVVENPEVWNQALRIESADILALPYVVPF
ncbi:PREDICTED: myb-like protein X [Camelina sativa]|uniref:Myb-like protein X n=1 Tax=Camelina sativa TaxID=90675 RepID=A0ABM0W1G0_CAMSA|nr:PREDICTED: myb-like protein X [Camelina sativa]